MTTRLHIYCTYCWTSHYAESLDWWIKNNQMGCGKDRSRYFPTKADYTAYVRRYEANGHQHSGPEQLAMFEEMK